MLLTEQEIRDIARSVKGIGENSDRALILAAQKAVIAKIKAQGNCIQYGEAGQLAKYYRLPEGD